MEKVSFRLTTLRINRMPGLPQGLKPYDAFSPQINIITGPNASGKTSTARAIQKLIWRHDTDRMQIDGEAETGEDMWSVRIDSGHVRMQRNGREEELSGLPAVEEKSRYMLALHELIQADEADLAHIIIKESIGGYDLDQAARELNYSPAVKPKGISPYRNYEKAIEKFRHQREAQKEIKKEEERLPDLHGRKRDAEEAKRLKELYERVISYLQAREDFKQRQQQYRMFPGVLQKVHGEEAGHIEELEEEIEEAQEAVHVADIETEKCQNTLHSLEIPETGIAPGDLDELEERVKRMEALEEEITRVESDYAEAEERKKEALKSIGRRADTTETPDTRGTRNSRDTTDTQNTPDDPEWKGLDLQDIGELDRFLEKAHRTASARRFFEKEIALLKKEQGDPPPGKDTLLKGIQALGGWLQESPGSSGFPEWVGKAIIGVALPAAPAAFFWWPAGIIGLILVMALTTYGLLESRKDPEHSRMQIRQDDYLKTGLNAPWTWNSEGVRQRLEELIEALQEAGLHERIAREMEKRKEQIASLQTQIDDINEQKKSLREKLSALPELPFEDPQNDNALYWFIIQAQKWQKAHEESQGLQKKHEAYRKEHETERKKCAELLNRYDLKAPSDARQSRALFEHLYRQEEQRRKTKEEIAHQSRTKKKNQHTIEQKTGKLKEIYAKLDTPFGQKENVYKLLDKREAFKKAENEYRMTEERLMEKKTAMENHPSFETVRPGIDVLEPEKAKERLTQFETRSEALDDIQKEITRIETRVTSLKSEYSLEDAIKERDEALMQLHESYQDNLTSLTGNLVMEQLKQEAREQNRPVVFYEANKLFNRITRGRYEINIDENDTPRFLAYDTIEKEGKALNELSTGTRIQLLLSVRMAFVETRESSVKLPILADELLANSDDARARAIIEALTGICREGRQVFYFTARADEVAKWHAYLSDKSDFHYIIHQLAADHHEVDFPADNMDPVPTGLLQSVPEPNGRSHEEYGKALNVESYHLLLNKPEQLHLWYLLEEPELLFRCMKQGIRQWGTLKSFLDHGGVIPGLDEKMAGAFAEKIRILDRFQYVFRQGRPRPIDRSVLEQSGVVSDKFIDQVTEKLEQLDKNPAALLKALKNGEVSGFRAVKTRALKQYLLEQGYLDDREPLENDEIQIRIQAVISRSELSVEEAERFLKSVGG